MDEENQLNSEDYSEELRKIRSEYSKAKKLLKNVEEFAGKFETLRDLLDNENDGVEANVEWVREKKGEIDSIKEQSQNSLNEITTNLQKIKENIESMQTAYNEFSEIKGEITGRSGEIENLLSTANSFKEDIERVKAESQETLESIKNAFTDVQGKIQAMQDAYQSFLQIKSKIDDENTGLEAVYNFFQDLQKKSKTIFEEIKSFRDESNKLLDDIKKNKSDTDKLKTKISSNFDFTEEKKGEIEDATGLIIDASFAETFERRKREIEKNTPTWKKLFYVSLVLLAIAVIFLQTPWSGIEINGTYEYILKRIVLTSPLLFLIVFSLMQYSNERDLTEKYAFKAASSAAIRSHIDYLMTNFPGQNEQVLEFAKNTFATIYKEPYQSDERLKKEVKRLEKEIKEMKGKGKTMGEIDINEMVESVKELKKLVSSETLLEKIIGVFIKK